MRIITTSALAAAILSFGFADAASAQQQGGQMQNIQGMDHSKMQGMDHSNMPGMQGNTQTTGQGAAARPNKQPQQRTQQPRRSNPN